MKKVILISVLILGLVLIAGVTFAAKGPSGYNWKAKVFVGTGMQYCQQRYSPTITKDACEAKIGEDADDHLVMKWSRAWHMAIFGPDNIRGGPDILSWSDAVDQYGSAWVNNQWNGMFPGGSGESYHSRIVWVGTPCDDTNPNWRDGGYCIWGQMEVIHKQGKDSSEHWWAAHGIPSGYGSP